MFAFAIWDRAHAIACCWRAIGSARSRLFLWQHADGIGFASELKSLLDRARLCARRGSRRAARLSRLRLRADAAAASFSHVRKLPAGHYAVYAQGQAPRDALLAARLRADLHRQRSRGRGATCRTLLDQAVATRLVSDVPFGAFLSGGLDSSVVVALDGAPHDAARQDLLHRLQRGALQRAVGCSTRRRAPAHRASRTDRRPGRHPA
jgi:asparagine synthase (glutamine-hydrolysing)